MKTPIILFPSEPFSPDEIDSIYASEYKAAIAIGFKTLLYDHEELITGNITTACSRIPQVESNCCSLLRGWMLKDKEFSALHKKLEEKGYTLLTTPEAYSEAHYIPNSYSHIQKFSPKSVWIEGDDMDNAWELYQTVSSQDNIIKDWVKSAKSQWLKGCFIPAESSKESFDSIYQTFREERATLFNKGIVFREYVPLKEKGYSIDNHPAVEEIRLFCFKGQILCPPQKVKPDPMENRSQWEQISKQFQSPFITIDIALQPDGKWIILEVGDGGVSGLPEWLTPEIFYSSLWNQFI